ncbi:hypothetical protein GCM10010449_73660 [Streptomyces rectiviolaceus]|uniref:Uncharacterized protein n=1 Tax=Streptomyces rectiviolaceus TaxID=332591 RepID=A0ABP6NC70_9ACTN
MLFRGGWADALFVAGLADEVVSEAVTSLHVLGELLDDYVFRAFGLSGSGSGSGSGPGSAL